MIVEIYLFLLGCQTLLICKSRINLDFMIRKKRQNHFIVHCFNWIIGKTLQQIQVTVTLNKIVNSFNENIYKCIYNLTEKESNIYLNLSKMKIISILSTITEPECNMSNR